MYGKLLNSPLPPPTVVGKFRLVYCTRYCHGCWYNVWKRLKRALLCLQIPHINQPDLRALLCRFPMSISLTWEPCFADSPCQSAWLESPALFADSPCQSAWLEPCFVCRFPMSISLTREPCFVCRCPMSISLTQEPCFVCRFPTSIIQTWEPCFVCRFPVSNRLWHLKWSSYSNITITAWHSHYLTLAHGQVDLDFLLAQTNIFYLPIILKCVLILKKVHLPLCK